MRGCWHDWSRARLRTSPSFARLRGRYKLAQDSEGCRERCLMRLLMVMVSSLAVSLSPAWCDEGHKHTLSEEEVGSVHFLTSCSKTVGVSFNHAVALLHSFQYEQA